VLFCVIVVVICSDVVLMNDGADKRTNNISFTSGLLRYLNQELHMYLPSILAHTDVPLSVPYPATTDKYPLSLNTEMKPLYDFVPIMTIVNTPCATRCDSDIPSHCLTVISKPDSSEGHTVEERKGEDFSKGNNDDISSDGREKNKDKEKERKEDIELEMSYFTGGCADPPWCNTASPPIITSTCHSLGPSTILLEGPGLIPTSKHRIFPDIKADHFSSSLLRSAVRSTRTEDDYDYPDDLPTVSINRFKSFRAKEESEVKGLSGEDFISASMLCQVWSELKNVPIERLRRNYSHPMDDGQARTFKVRYT
jgi:hypothetical protein